MPGLNKRFAEYVPDPAIRGELDKLSKASLMEIVWDYAKSETGGDESTNARIYDDILKRARTVANVTGAKLPRLKGGR